MARENILIVKIRDDLDGRELAEEEARKLTFSFEGHTWELDVHPENYEAFAEYVGRYSRAGRKVQPSRTTQAKTTAADKARRQAIRKWAAENGIELKSTGRIQQSIVDAYDEAHRS